MSPTQVMLTLACRWLILVTCNMWQNGVAKSHMGAPEGFLLWALQMTRSPTVGSLLLELTDLGTTEIVGSCQPRQQLRAVSVLPCDTETQVHYLLRASLYTLA